jgi:hypothetical protein
MTSLVLLTLSYKNLPDGLKPTKTQVIIFCTRGKKIDLNDLDVIFNSNDLNTV